MLRFAALSLTALGAATAYAQVPEAAMEPAPGTTAPVTGAPTNAPAQPGAAIDPAAPEGAAPTASAAPAEGNSNAQVAAVIEAGFPKYDVDQDGKLSEAEFKQWISDLKTQELAATGQPADPAVVSQYASAAWAAADRTNSGAVTKEDLTTFLGG